MEKISATDRMRNDEVFLQVKERNIPTDSKNKEGWLDCSRLAYELHSKTRHWRKDRCKKWRKDEERDVTSYWMTLRKREDTVNWKRRHSFALLWRTHSRRGYGPVVRHDRMNDEWEPHRHRQRNGRSPLHVNKKILKAYGKICSGHPYIIHAVNSNIYLQNPVPTSQLPL